MDYHPGSADCRLALQIRLMTHASPPWHDSFCCPRARWTGGADEGCRERLHGVVHEGRALIEQPLM
eukprot:155528-Amphidinium_carterae.1